MSLEGAKIICLNDCASEQNEIISAQGRTFKFGYYMDCDVVLEHPDAMGLQCTIDCDAFGRVTIENRCPDQTMTLNGEILKKIRPLLNNTEICIFDKKFLWQFEGNPKSGGFQMEDIDDFTTPCKQTKKAEQPPNSEPARRWRTQFNKRLTIYSFAYCIKANESPKDVEITTDENKPLNTYERIIPVDSVAPALATVKRLSVSPPPIAADLIDLKTPKARQRSLAGQKTPLSCCKLSETVITSYSPRETGVRPEKSFALVQSPAATPAKSNAFSDVSLGIIQHLPSPLTVSHRPSMHLIDLTTPKKRVQPFSPARTLLKSTLKKNIPTTSGKLHQRRSIAETITTSMESVYSVPSTDDESVIELSDEGNFSPSPVPKTPLRKTPQSLMKHAIISSAKKAAITKRLNLAVKQTPPRLMFTPPGASGVRFQSQSTPQRKSLGRLQSPSDSQKPTQSVEGKPAKSIFTSTPFRAAEFVKSKRSILHTPSTSLTGVKNKSRTSLMLKHALSKSLQTSSAKKRKSVSFIEATKSPAVRARKSVSFLERIESEGNQSLNRTFSIEEEKEALPKKDATFSPEKEKLPSSQEPSGSKELRLSFPTIIITDEEVCSSPPKTESSYVSEVPATDKVAISSEQKPECLISHSEIKAAVPPASDCAATRTEDTTKLSALQTPQSSRDPPNEAKTALAASVPTEKLHPNMDVMEDDDFEGLDAIFKTPKAKNLMILGSPKSISLQKPTPDSVELIHSTEFDLSANLDDIFKTPQSEFIVNRVEEESTPANVENMEPYSPEEAFDLLVGRPITRKTYANKTTPPKQDLPPLNVPRDNSLPKTDIEEWIDNVHDSIQLIVEGDDDDEDEMAFLTATQNEFPRHPLLTSSVSGSVSTTNKMTRFRSPKDESAMTIEEDAEGEETDNASALKDPLEMAAFSSPTKQPSPNISGIDLLDHTSESLFSETLEVSDESSGKESDKTLEQVDDVSRDDVSNADGDINISPDKARREMEEAFKNFEKERKMLEVNRLVSTPEPAKPVARVNRRKTMGSQQTLHAYFDVKLLKKERDMEIAFENFKKEPTTAEPRLCKTPDVKRAVRYESRKTTGNPVGGELDVNAIKAEREMKLAFENFIEKPVYIKDRAVQTPEPVKVHFNDHRRSMGSALVTEMTLDLKAVKAERDTELAFENFEENPQNSKERCAQTPEPKKTTMKDHRTTMGSNLVTEVTLDLEAAKEQLEMEKAFENFKDEPEFSQVRTVQTPEPKKTGLKDHRRTMGSNLVTEVTLDIEAVKAQLEMDQAFENFEDEPEFSQERAAQTPEPKKTALKDHRRTMGSNLVTEVTLDLEAAKEQLEMEQAFENFEDEPEFSQERAAQTPEPKKTAMKDHRRTMGSNLVTEVTLDLEAAKEQLEMEKAFENFEKDPTVERLKSTEASALEPSIRKENEELAPVMEISDAEDACETNQVVAVSDSDKAINEENNSKEELITQAYEQPSHSPRTRRRRQNTIDEVLEAKSNRTTDIVDIATIVPAQPKSRRRRQPTIDDVNQLKQQEETPQMQARTRRGRLNSVEAGSSLKDEHNHRVNDPTPQQPKTEIETDTSLKRDEDHEMDQNQTKQSASTLRKLVKKSTTEEGVHSSEADFTTSLSTEVTAITADSEIHNQLEPIAEEDKMVAAQIDGAAAKSEAKSIRLVADQNQDEFRENPTPKSVLNLNAEVDEIASTPKKSSSNRIRGRTAQLSVVLVESKNKSSPSVHGQHADEIKMEADVTCAEVKHEPTAEGHDADEVIQCTPAPTKTRGRRPAHKVESAEVAAPALRRGRRGSVQQDVDVKAVEQVVSPTPLPTKLRGRKGLLKGESTDGGSSPVVDLIPPTPEITRPRGRRAAIKVEASKTTTESVTPSRNRGRPGEDAIHAEEAAEAPVESVIKEENRRRSTHDIHAAAVVPIAPLTVQVLPVRKRGRKKANADPVLLTEESDVAVEEKDQMGSVENADGNKNEVAVPSTAEKAPLRKRGRKKAVADPNLSTDRTDVPPLTGSITSQRRSDFERSEAHVDKVASPPTDPSGEEKRKSLKRTDNASETSVASNEKSTPPRKRGRRGINANPKSSAPSTPAAALALETEHISDKGELVDTEVKASAAKRGRKKAVQDPNTNEEGISVGPTEDVSKSLSQTRRAGRKEDVDHPSPHNNIDPITPSSGTGEPLKSTTEESIPVDDCQANAEEVVPPNPEPPKKRGRKPKLANSVSDALTPNVSESTQLPIKTRGRRGVLKSESVDTDAESPAQKRARKRVIDAASAQITASETTEKVDDSEKVAAIQQDQTETEEAAPSTPLPSKPRGRRPALKAELIRPASSTPVRGRGRRAAEEPVLPLKIEPTTENANAGRKRGRKPAEKEEITVDTVKSEPIQPADVVAQPGRKGGRRVIVEAEILTEDDDVEKVIRSQQQTQQEASTSELTELLSGSGPNGNNIPAKKRGRPAAVKSEPTPESSTPVRKRGRKAAAKEEVEPTETAESSAKGVPADNVDREEPPSSKPDPPRARRLPAKLKESVTESITPRQRKARNPARSKCEEESSDFDQTPVKAEVTSSSRPIRSRRASAKEDFAEEPIALAEQKLPPVSEESENKPTRGRKAQPKKDATIDSTASHTEEELPPHPIKTKPTRGRKPTVRADTPLTTEKPQIEDTNKSKRGRKSNPTETGTPSEDEVEGTPVPTRKTTRNKVGAQIESLHSDGNQSVKKTARGRKATTAETDDGHSYASDTPKNKTRSRKVPQPVAQRALQRNMEIPAEDDQDCTPSKRIRRKPNILLGDEFVH